MSEINTESDSGDSNASKRTILGVGLATLLGPRQVTRTIPPPSSSEPSIEVSGEIAAAVDEATPIAVPAQRTTSKIARSPSVLPPMPDSKRWLRIGLVAGGALAASIVIGLGVRHVVSSSDSGVAAAASAPSPRAPAPSAPAARVPVAAPRAPIATPAPVAAAAAAPAATASNVVASAPPPPAAKPAPAAPGKATPRAVDLGDGSCSVLIDANSIGDVVVDDQAVGATPVAVSGLWCGRQMTIRINRRGFEPWSKSIVTQEGRMSRVMATLRVRPPAPPVEVASPTPQPVVIRLPIDVEPLRSDR